MITIPARKKKLLATSKSHFSNEEIEAKKQEEETLYNFEKLDFTDVPTTLDRDGKKEWNRLSAIIGELPLSELDRSTVTNYCMYTSLMDQARRQLKKESLITENGKKNPLIDVINGASKELKSLTASLGLTIDSRLKISSPTKEREPDDPFGSLLGKVNKEADSDD